MIIHSWDIHFKCVSEYTKKSINLVFELGEHVGGGRLDDGVI